jgi:DNA-cytosine methyltransferase
MKVVSLFDGISCLRVALGDREVEYLASEIDPYALKVSKANYPDIKQLGDVKKVSGLEGIDLLCGGSPCTDLSVAKKDRKGLEGKHSSLFYEYLRILREIKPKWFILENVNSMPKKDRDIITKEMGVEPIMIDASLVSAQSRKRLFWTNIPVVGLPTDRKIFLKDILQPDADIDEKMFLKSEMKKTEKKNTNFDQIGYFGSKNACGVGGQALRVYDTNKKSTTSGVGLYKVGHIGKSDGQGNRVYSPEGKSVTLSANGGGGGAKTGLYQVSPYPIHIPTGSSKEIMRVGHEQRRKLNENGTRADDSDVEAIRRIETRNDDKSGTLTTVLKDNHIVNTQESKIRKLTPIECERLQSLPDDYTKGISTTQRYRCLGNAFNVEVIKFILSFIPK